MPKRMGCLKMEELKIEIDCLKARKSGIQIAISRPFEYDRWPPDDEFYALIPLLSELTLVQGKIDVLEEVLHSVISNNSIARLAE